MLFLAGLFIGGLVGFGVACLCVAARNREEAITRAMPLIEVEILEEAVLHR